MTTNKGYVNITNAREEDGYKQSIKDIMDQGVCPFCPEHFKWHKNPTLFDIGDWIATESSWPYENAEYHFLIISKVHKENFSELTGEDMQNVLALVNLINEKYGIEGGGLIVRFGNTQFTGATVAHLHFHLVCPKISENGDAKTVWFPIG